MSRNQLLYCILFGLLSICSQAQQLIISSNSFFASPVNRSPVVFDTKAKFSFSIGIGIIIPVRGNFYGYMGFEHQALNYEISQKFNQIGLLEEVNFEEKLNYLALPVYFVRKFRRKIVQPYFKIGLTPQFLLNSNLEILDNNTYDTKSLKNKFNILLGFEVGTIIPIGSSIDLFTGLSLSNSLRNLNNDKLNNDLLSRFDYFNPDVRVWGLGIWLGIGIPVFK